MILGSIVPTSEVVMMCYKDQTFCSSPNCKNECGRKITEEDLKTAEKLDLPISYTRYCE